MKLHSLFYPKSVAVVGASQEKGTVGNDLVKNLLAGFKGPVYPVNPKGGKLYDRKVYPDLASIKKPVELVVIAVPAKIVPSILDQAGKLKAKAVIVISAGFREVGNLKLENELIALSTKYNLPMIGPNCLGLLNPEIKLNASFASIMPEAGSLAFISQSGAICSSVLDYSRERGLGFSKFVSIGNKAVIGEVELLEYLYRDPKTKVVLMYVEQLSQIARLMKITKKMTDGRPRKPIIILKSGRTQAGAKASHSHTGSMGGSDAAYDALFAQSGMIRAETISELFDFAECFAHNRIPKKNRVAVVTNAGGPGVLTTDELVESELELAKLSQATQDKLRQFLPAAASVQNPVDILGDAPAERYQRSIEVVLKDSEVDAVQVILTPQSMTQVEATARAIAQLKQQTTKPIIVTFMGQQAVEKGVKLLQKGDVATTLFPEPGARSLSALNRFRQAIMPKNDHRFRFRDVKKDTVERLIAQAQKNKQRLLDSDTSYKILKAYGLPLIRRKVATTLEEAETIATKFDTTLVLKIVSPDISHKTDVGGVMLGVEPKDIRKKYQELRKTVAFHQPEANLTGVEIMEMVADQGLEMIIGATTDPSLGKVVMVGLGGIYTEALKDVAWGLAPLTHSDTKRMISSLKAFEILKGSRGQRALAVGELAESLGRISQLVTDFPEIKELDINPIKVLKKDDGALVLDARIIIF